MKRRNGFVSGAVLLLATMLLLTGCGKKSENAADASGSNSSTATLSGVAAAGAPIASATITLKDKAGAIKTVTTGADGKYSADITGLTAPFLLKIQAGTTTLYSVATAEGTANIHPFTDLIVRNWYQAKGSNVVTDFAATGPLTLQPTAGDIATVETVVRNMMKTWLAHEGLDATNFNLLTSSFDANNAGFDKVLDSAKVTIDTAGQVTVVSTDLSTGFSGTTISVNIANLAIADTASPTVPTELTALAANTTRIVAFWTASTDNVGVSGYNVYRGGVKLATSPYPVYSDTGLAAGTKYCYQVEALDGAGNTSAKSAEACATTLAAADTTAPTAPGSPVATVVAATQADLVWTVSTDNVAVMGYQVYRGATKIGTVATTKFSDTAYTAGACYTVKAFDAAGNVSAASSQACGTTAPAPAAAPTVWKVSFVGGTVYNETPASGMSAYLTLVLNQSGNTLSGTMGFQDTLGRSGTSNITGSISGNAITTQHTDFDPTCASRAVTMMGTMSATTLTISSWSAPAAGSCGAVGPGQLTFTLAAPVTKTASGTYSFLASSGTLTMNTTASTFGSNNGPSMGIHATNGVTVNATTQTWVGNDNMTWTRASGIAGDITGTWIWSSLTGDTTTFTLNAAGTFTMTGYIVSGVRGNAQVWTQTWSDGYYAELRYNDSSYTATSVSVTGPGISGSLALMYDSSYGAWHPSNWKVPFGATHPAAPLTYTFSVTNASGTTTATATAMCFMEVFATPISGPKSGGSQTFTWTKVPYPNMRYTIELHSSSNGNNIWGSYDSNNNPIDVSSMTYTGPTLTPGTTYQYNLNVSSTGDGGFDCTSFKQASFVY